VNLGFQGRGKYLGDGFFFVFIDLTRETSYNVEGMRMGLQVGSKKRRR